MSIISFEHLFEVLSKVETDLVNKILKAKPQQFGFRGNWLGIVDVPSDLVKLEGQIYIKDNQEKVLPVQFLPKSIYELYIKLNKSITNDIGKSLLIDSGYRSPAYQILLIIYYLKLYEFDISKTFQRVAMPGYSEHNYPPRQALDFMTADGMSTDDEPLVFANSDEYTWLLKNANKFNFYLSYPENNTNGIIFEPWHWHYEE